MSDLTTPPEPARKLIGATGKQVRLIFPDPLNPNGSPIPCRVTIMGDPFTRGWRLPSNGGWALYRPGDDSRPSWWVPVRRYRKRKVVRVSIDDLIAVTEGWGS